MGDTQLGIEENKMFNLTSIFALNGANSNDIVVVPNSLLIIADILGKRLIKSTLDGEQITHISLPGGPGRITVLNETTVAVTILKRHTVVIIDVRNNYLKEEISMLTECRGIMFAEDQIYVGCVIEKNIKVINQIGVIRQCISTPFSPKNICAGVDGLAYCIDNFEYDLLFCINIFSGKVLLTFQHTDMKGPRGITVDDNRHLLVVCAYSKNVLRISPDFKYSYSIIKEIPIPLSYPSICYEPLTKHIVISEADKICLYKS